MAIRCFCVTKAGWNPDISSANPVCMVTEKGKTDYKFGWHVAADSVEYVSFLKQYIGAIV